LLRKELRAELRQVVAWIVSGTPEQMHAVWVEYGGDPNAGLDAIRRTIDKWTDSGARLATSPKGHRPPSAARATCRLMIRSRHAARPDESWAAVTRTVAAHLRQEVRWVRRDATTRW
jgi:hypothetical protein